MNVMENAVLQDMILRQRKRHIAGGYGWPGKSVNAPAVTHYPNILAELGHDDAPWLGYLADWADVSQEIMAAVLEDNEELSFPELFRLGQFMGVSCEYLAAPRLSVIDPATKKGKVKRRELKDLFTAWEDKLEYRWKDVANINAALDCGMAVSYADYRWAIGMLRDAITKQQRALHEPRSRRIREVTA